LVVPSSALAGDSGPTQISASVTKVCQINTGSSTLIDLTGFGVNVWFPPCFSSIQGN